MCNLNQKYNKYYFYLLNSKTIPQNLCCGPWHHFFKSHVLQYAKYPKRKKIGIDKRTVMPLLLYISYICDFLILYNKNIRSLNTFKKLEHYYIQIAHQCQFNIKIASFIYKRLNTPTVIVTDTIQRYIIHMYEVYIWIPRKPPMRKR